jgi:uracil-DNA glycosylase family 4
MSGPTGPGTAGTTVRTRDPSPDSLDRLERDVVACRRCPRLVAWREEVARVKAPRYRDEDYWGRPLPGFGDPAARLLLVGLAPAAHGGNRTGRVFTGDRSGDWLFRALHKAGFADRAESVRAGDGLVLSDCRIAAAARCAPPLNKPLPEEFAACRPFLLREIRLLPRLRVVMGLGRIGFDRAFDALRETHGLAGRPRPAFSHGAEHRLADGLHLLGTFHPSQQNTFTGRLTEPMLDAVFARARVLLDGADARG